MFRRLRYIVLLMLLVVALAALLRSFVAAESVYLMHATRHISLSSTEGTFILALRHVSFDSEAARELWLGTSGSSDPEQWQLGWAVDIGVRRALSRSLGFAFEARQRPGRRFDGIRRVIVPGTTVNQVLIEVPGWFVILALGGFPVYRLLQRDRLRRERAAHGLCVSCGYEAGPAYITCPQCGKKVRDESELNSGGLSGEANAPAATERSLPSSVRIAARLRRGVHRSVSN